MSRAEMFHAFAIGVVAGGVLIGSIWPVCWLIAKLGGISL